MAERVAAYIWYWKSFKPDMNAYHGHSHLLTKVVISPKISEKYHVQRRYRMGRREGSVVGAPHFWTSVKWPLFLWPCKTNLNHHAKFFGLLTSFAFYEIFSIKKPKNGRTCRKLIKSVAGCCKKLKAFIQSPKKQQLSGLC